jgi:hypothetical protein
MARADPLPVTSAEPNMAAAAMLEATAVAWQRIGVVSKRWAIEVTFPIRARAA